MRTYIFTRSRPESLAKVVPAWAQQGIPVSLVVEPGEFEFHCQLRDDSMWNNVSILALPRPNLGMGFARNFAVVNASEKGYKSIIVSDDDIKPARGSDMQELMYEAARSGVLGIGAAHGLHDRFTQGAISRNRGQVIMCPGGWGFTLYGLNVANALRLGSFDPALDCFGEDAELARVGIANGIPWRLHCGVWADYFSKRYAPGGMSSLFPEPGQRAKREIACRRIIHGRWPKYTSKPEAKPRMAWQKMLTAYIPDWKSRSAIHGGSL